MTIIPGPVSFDLVELTGVEGVIGSAELAPGRYNQVRLTVVDVIVTVDDEDQSATVPSGKLRFAGGFDLIAGETTILTLDFDADKSIVIRGNRPPLLKPVVKLLSRQGDEQLSDATQVSEGELPDGDEETDSQQIIATTEVLVSHEVSIALPNIGIQNLALHVALEAGFFERHGVNVTLVAMENPFDVMRAVRTGAADLAVLPIFQVVNSLSSPQPLVAIGAIGGSTQLNVVLAGHIAEQLGLTEDSELDDRLSGLAGIRLAHPPGPLGINTARAVVQAAGLDPDQDAELVPILGGELAGTLAEGLVDGFVGHHPDLEIAIVEGEAIMLLHLTGGRATVGGRVSKSSIGDLSRSDHGKRGYANGCLVCHRGCSTGD